MPKVILEPVPEKQASEPIVVRLKGGPGSGHHGHAGRPGKRGGSAPGGGGGGVIDYGDVVVDDSNWDQKGDPEEQTREQLPDDMIQFIDSWNDWRDNLSTAEEEAVYNFTDLHDVNDVLREGGTRDDVALIDSALSKASAPRDMVVYRGYDPEVRKLFETADVGAVFEDAGYISTSLTTQVIPRFSKGTESVRIVVTKGQSAAFLSGNATVHPEELEVLLPRNSRFQLTSRDSTGITLTYVEE